MGFIDPRSVIPTREDCMNFSVQEFIKCFKFL